MLLKRSAIFVPTGSVIKHWLIWSESVSSQIVRLYSNVDDNSYSDCFSSLLILPFLSLCATHTHSIPNTHSPCNYPVFFGWEKKSQSCNRFLFYWPFLLLILFFFFWFKFNSVNYSFWCGYAHVCEYVSDWISLYM